MNILLCTLCFIYGICLAKLLYGPQNNHNTTPLIFEPCHEIMVLSVLCKLILQTHMRSHPVALDVLICGRTLRVLPYLMCANSEGSRLCRWAGSPEPSLVAHVISTMISFLLIKNYNRYRLCSWVTSKAVKHKVLATSEHSKNSFHSLCEMSLPIWNTCAQWRCLCKPYSSPIGGYLSCDMTKPTKLLCAQQRLRSASASAQSDQSLLYA